MKDYWTVSALTKWTINESTVYFGRTVNTYSKDGNTIFEHDFENKKFIIDVDRFYEKCKIENGVELERSEVLEKINSALEKILRVEGYETEIDFFCIFGKVRIGKL